MLRRLLFAVVFAAPAVLFAQQANQIASQPGIAQPSSPTVVVVPANPSVYVTGGSYGVYLIPLATLPRQEIGISLAARQGISMEAPVQTGVVTALPSPYNFGAPIAYPSVLGGNAGTAYVGAGETGRLINDFGPSYYVGETKPSPPAPSLGEYARAYKQSHRRAVRIFTNADADRLANSGTVPSTAPPSQEQNPAVKPPQQKENLRENRKPQTPRSTASVLVPAEDDTQQ